MSSPRPPPVAPSAVVADRDVGDVTSDEPFSDAYSGDVFTVQRWGDELRRLEAMMLCPAHGNRDGHVYGADGSGRLALTMDIKDSQAVMDETADMAPYAFVVDANGCHAYGRAIILAVCGSWASGYCGYLGRSIAATNYGTDHQRNVAVRWNGTRLTELGDGVAYAISTHGVAVGATDIAGHLRTVIPHAVAWDATGHEHALETSAARSVAYDVADDGTIVGKLENRSGRHYAYRRSHGKLERLDDLPHPAGWRFESAYAIATDGSVVGIGMLDGRATVYRWRP